MGANLWESMGCFEPLDHNVGVTVLCQTHPRQAEVSLTTELSKGVVIYD